jgi:hypothetical protein
MKQSNIQVVTIIDDKAYLNDRINSNNAKIYKIGLRVKRFLNNLLIF